MSNKVKRVTSDGKVIVFTGQDFIEAEHDSGHRQAVIFDVANVDQISGEVDFGSSALRWGNLRGELKPEKEQGNFQAELYQGRLLTPLALFPELSREAPMPAARMALRGYEAAAARA